MVFENPYGIHCRRCDRAPKYVAQNLVGDGGGQICIVAEVTVPVLTVVDRVCTCAYCAEIGTRPSSMSRG